MRKDEGIDRIFDKFRWFIIYQKALEQEAYRQYAEEAYSYRNFHVGCAMLGSNGKQCKIFGGANLMHRQGGNKACGEDIALKKAVKAGFDKILAIVVVGCAQADQESGQCPPTLHPCGGCRVNLARSGCVEMDTIIYTIDPVSERSELQSFQQLQIYHCSLAA